MLSHDFNRTMLFHIGRSEIQLINPEVKSVQLNKHFRDIAHCCQVSGYYTEREMIQWLMVFTDMMIIYFLYYHIINFIIILLSIMHLSKFSGQLVARFYEELLTDCDEKFRIG